MGCYFSRTQKKKTEQKVKQKKKQVNPYKATRRKKEIPQDHEQCAQPKSGWKPTGRKFRITKQRGDGNPGLFYRLG